jgi:hypothetical protein
MLGGMDTDEEEEVIPNGLKCGVHAECISNRCRSGRVTFPVIRKYGWGVSALSPRDLTSCNGMHLFDAARVSVAFTADTSV